MIYWHKYYRISKNKNIELQISKWVDTSMFNIRVWPRKHDHVGIEIAITLFYIEFSYDWYDSRHYGEL